MTPMLFEARVAAALLLFMAAVPVVINTLDWMRRNSNRSEAP